MTQKTQQTARFALALTLAFIASCDGTSTPPTPPPSSAPSTASEPSGPVGPWVDEATWANAIVLSDSVTDLAAFEQKFKEVLGDADLEAHQIGCIEGCDKLTDPSTQRLKYVFPRELQGVFDVFGKTWDAVEKVNHNPMFTLQYDGGVGPSDCTTHPQPCQSMPFCSDRCGRKVGGCTAC